jgi:hypothetical protein
LSTTHALTGWPYLLLGVITAPMAWRRRREPAGRVAVVALASAWLYLAPLIVLVPAELRYLGWCCLASVLAAALAWLVPKATGDGSNDAPAKLGVSTLRTFR